MITACSILKVECFNYRHGLTLSSCITEILDINEGRNTFDGNMRWKVLARCATLVPNESSLERE
ncbi:hypothetical protein SERLA73DRAFT_177390 [Serpula lacrymans var. lacrymans S7.3]|uniref:Uncharacterized protein n=2 Tax=Serpula lacrymans var. lacrymans TaxID=341189 RepID=F8PNX4_SERL3|nr:uncharacterized protein SERLADRAFT_460959 [Serpula lacrymans var. lacrymans S7.9]EGO01851.1 hypothetical protein SERLA73DRAFT_177390 [Serpula lacrymans var. lacrymans S7.3]EGO27478.1 hypothetical protein SERLADRAFT_460959 [Serpula lacrymans var. lacrymans S7.9]